MKTKQLFVSLGLGWGLMLALLWLLGAALVPAVQANPGTIRVATTGSDTSGCGGTSNPCRTVQYAVDHALSGDTILVATGVYSDIHFNATDGVTQVVYINKNLTIKGGYTAASWTTPDPEANPTTLDARGQGRVIYITSDVTVTLEGLRILNGAAEKGGGSYPSFESGGGIFSAARALTIRNSTVMSNTAFTDHDSYSLAGRGGGIYQDCAEGTGLCAYTPAFCVEDSHFLSNTAEYDGGGIYLYGSDAVLENVTFAGNRAWYNGGGLASSGGSIYVNGGNPVVLENNTFITNTADMGGGLSVRDATLTMTDNLVQDNLAYHYAGGATIYQCNATVADNTFEENRSQGWGGGLDATWGDLLLTGNTFRQNVASASSGGGGFYGGGIHAGHIYTITDNLFQGNIASRDGSSTGGGVRIIAGTAGDLGFIVFSRNRLLNNVASDGPTGTNGGRGGGAHISGPALVSQNLFQNNWGCTEPPSGGYEYGGYGGALYLTGAGQGEAAAIQVEGNRFLDNRAARDAGTTISQQALGGAMYVAPYDTVVTMTNNIFAGNVYCEDCTGYEETVEWYRGGGAVAIEGSPYGSTPDALAYLYHNTFVDNQSTAVRVSFAAAVTMSHNIFSGHTTDVSNVRIYDYVCPTSTADYTLWWSGKNVVVRDVGSPQCSPPLTTNDFVGDPAFSDVSQDDYHLTSGSAAIDRGPGVGVTTDIDGNPRPIGVGYDLGADEYTNVDLGTSSRKTADPPDATAGQRVTFTIVLFNSGTADAPNTTLFDPIPASTTYVPGSAQATSGVLTDTGGIIWTGMVPAQTAVTITFQVTVDQDVLVANTATVTDTYGASASLTAWVNARRVYLPLVLRSMP